MMQKTRWLSDGTLLLIAAIWGLTFVLVQDAIATIPPFLFVAIRFGWAALFLLPFLARKTQNSMSPAALSRSRTLISGGLLGFFLFLGYVLQTFSLLYTTSGKSGFLTGLSVALVPLLAWLILRSRPAVLTLAGVGVATFGLYLLAFIDISTINPGDVLAFLCAIAFGLQVVYTGKFSGLASAHSLAFIQLSTVAVLSAVAVFIFEPWQSVFQRAILLQPAVIIALVVTSVFATALAYLAQTHIQKYTTPARVALIFATEPVFAALVDYLWHGTTLSLRSFTGCLLILGGTLLTEIKWPWRTSPEHP
ncbi:DMT family transporter [Dictyobacter formicarum]|uniref:Membrane protein n=1 Tax=Dictyobacter formicarum TaxID=2778368 RepID=A0ABQ3VAF3_9CHLR|nr:DMT family transporter [Dictyobacter formicarum]GHO82819.1 membrane protein [Dictyobacter formicarum]